MIQSVTIKNFKSFREATLPLAPLTLLIGANASGKSNAIEAMQLLSWLASGRELNDLLYAVREDDLSLRGGFKDLSSDSEISLGCQVTEDSEKPPLKFSISIEITERGLRLIDERILLGSVPLYPPGGIAPTVKRLPTRFDTVFEDLRSWHSQALAQEPAITGALSSMFFLDPDPRQMRTYSFAQEKRLKRDGSALSSVLYRLTEEEGKKGEILELIRSLPEQDITDISYIETPRNEVMVQIYETFG
ncbi:MAG: AAA family ATPase, partial [Thermoanaerobaculia bacterium]